MNSSQQMQLKSAGLVDAPHPGRHWCRFNTRHLLALTACVAIAITGLNVAVEIIGYTHTTVEIINYHSNWETTGSVEFLVLLPDGFSQSGVSIPANASSVDYSKLVGAKYPMRYRAQRILWLVPENPSVVAYKLVQAKIDQFANEMQAE